MSRVWRRTTAPTAVNRTCGPSEKLLATGNVVCTPRASFKTQVRWAPARTTLATVQCPVPPGPVRDEHEYAGTCTLWRRG